MPREETNLVSGSNAIVLRGPSLTGYTPYITGRVSRETSSSFGAPTAGSLSPLQRAEEQSRYLKLAPACTQVAQTPLRIARALPAAWRQRQSRAGCDRWHRHRHYHGARSDNRGIRLPRTAAWNHAATPSTRVADTVWFPK